MIEHIRLRRKVHCRYQKHLKQKNTDCLHKFRIWVRPSSGAASRSIQVKLGELMRVHTMGPPEEATWMVTRGGGCALYREAGGGERVGRLPEGAHATCTSESGEWATVRTPEGAEAWVEIDAFLAG